MKKTNKTIILGITLALMSAFFYAFNFIYEKMFLTKVSGESILFLMYFGAFAGLYTIHLFSKNLNKSNKNKITKKEVPKVLIMILCELFASLLIIEALKIVNAGLVSLLLVFEIVMTSIIAYLIFKEPIKNNDLISIFLIIIGFIILNFNPNSIKEISVSSLLVIGACLFWGVENNITGLISSKEPSLFTSVKCLAVSILYLIISFFHGTLDLSYPILMFYGFMSYGLGMILYALSTKYLGANRATLVFSFNPIFGVFLALVIFKEQITITFLISLIFMISAIICLNKSST